LDPIQASLIPAHVTLCREDELGDMSCSDIETTLGIPAAQVLTLQFGRPLAFQGHGLLLPCVAGEAQFRTLRELILTPAKARRHEPHITLAHPRNPKSDNNSLASALELPDGLSFRFCVVQLIEQAGAAPWRLVREFALNATPGNAR
jgi:hypothetical protein